MGKYVLQELSNFIKEKDGKYYYKDYEIPIFKSFQDLINIKG
jgi:hypothetical protein